jgi:hypothetical protein
MKKYMQPSVEVIEMETSQVIADSLGVNKNETTDQQGIGRRRGDDWSNYEGLE